MGSVRACLWVRGRYLISVIVVAVVNKYVAVLRQRRRCRGRRAMLLVLFGSVAHRHRGRWGS